MRSWVVWDVFPSKTLLFVMSADAKVPPRPLGAPKALRNNTANGDPKLAVSRERIYLDAPAEPGSIGQCCLVFRSSAPSMQTPTTEESPTLQRAYQTSTNQPVRQPVLPLRIGQIRQGLQPAGQSPIFPATPLQSGPPPVSAERRGPTTANLPASGPAASLPASLPLGTSPPIDMEPQTPHTADAVSSLALMQSLSRRSAIGVPDFDEGFSEQHDTSPAYQLKKASLEMTPVLPTFEQAEGATSISEESVPRMAADMELEVA